jgi:putative ABC transport system permease protein
MFLALHEMRRARVRFGLLICAVGLLVFLILTQQAIQGGLITGFVGAIRQQSAPVLVYSVDGQRTLQGSVIDPGLEATIRGVDGVAGAGWVGQSTFTVRVDGGVESDAALIGYQHPGLGDPSRLSAGRRPVGPTEAVGSAADFTVGSRVRVVPNGPAGTTGPVFTVVGLVEDAQIQVTPTLFVPWAGYEAAVRAANPDATTVLPSVIAVRPASGVGDTELVRRIDASSSDADALTRSQAAGDAPGVSQVQQSFQLIFLLYGLVVPLVTGLFFLIVTFQKAAALTLLRAVGARSGTLVRSLLIQVVLVVGGGIVIGTALFAPLTLVPVGAITIRFDPGAVLFWSAALLVLGLASAMVAARRVLAIDPREATTGAGGL